jgi:nucleotide-binding universal stress UspA family protein
VLAKVLRCNLYAIYVVSPKAELEKDKNIRNGMRVLGRTKIKAAEIGVELNTLLEAGDPYSTIMEAAERTEADMIIVGSSGKKSRFSGSTADSIYKNSGCTVTVVR